MIDAESSARRLGTIQSELNGIHDVLQDRLPRLEQHINRLAADAGDDPATMARLDQLRAQVERFKSVL